MKVNPLVYLTEGIRINFLTSTPLSLLHIQPKKYKSVMSLVFVLTFMCTSSIAGGLAWRLPEPPKGHETSLPTDRHLFQFHGPVKVGTLTNKLLGASGYTFVRERHFDEQGYMIKRIEKRNGKIGFRIERTSKTHQNGNIIMMYNYSRFSYFKSGVEEHLRLEVTWAPHSNNDQSRWSRSVRVLKKNSDKKVGTVTEIFDHHWRRLSRTRVSSKSYIGVKYDYDKNNRLKAKNFTINRLGKSGHRVQLKSIRSYTYTGERKTISSKVCGVRYRKCSTKRVVESLVKPIDRYGNVVEYNLTSKDKLVAKRRYTYFYY